MQRIDSLQPINASAALVVAILIGNRSAKTASLKVVGVAVVEEVERAFRAALVPVDSGAGLRHALQAGDVWCTGTVCCGVQLMWVADALRRNNICRNMIECARKHLCYGQEIQKEYVAFLEPTEMGIRFAQKYAGRDDFLVYY
ncbi:hypothetical protein AGDE_13621 [Angomonas deanei]|uniref:ESCO1/2 acetyl-transferase, putative n=1 Tax=Angomonas deanei TaxID=59799 RepID=A0A7G2C864_9TRYP|nr:hypothetical protein AGDE_13621 [Angomonas deanei]CAD2215284.1 ESCO1/2 acetyl-transferase, putative [Angomonas deanei]|eukprot:EPY22059.1 hypothetical protein AGDE_13621 [Angomonas deanei]